VCCDGNDRNWTWEWPRKWPRYARKWSREWDWNWKWHRECHRKVNWLGTFVSRRSTIFDWLLFSFVHCFVWNGRDSRPGGVLSWLEVRISLYQGLWCNLYLLWIAPLVIDRPYVDATCLVTRYNRHIFAYACTHSTTRAHATVQHFGPYRQPIHQLWVNVVAPPFEYPWCKTMDHWRAVEANFEDWARSVSLFLQLTKTPDNSTLDGHD